MEENLINKILSLVYILRERDQKSFVFFENILKELRNGNVNKALDALLPCYVIVQYANFNSMEEKILSEILDIANEIKNQLS